MRTSVTRRDFIVMAGAAIAAAGAASAQAQAGPQKKPAVCIFSKHLQFLDSAAMAKTLKQIGADGVDLAVREGGHVLPKNVAEDLPRAVETMRGAGIDVPMITTRLCSGEDPDARQILQAASKAGIGFFRIGPRQYDKTGSILEQLAKLTEELRGLTKIAEEFNITAGYHNHSGENNAGAALWDLQRMIETIGSPRFGSNFDVGHAMAEGASGVWRTNARLMAPNVKMMAVKDFVWNKNKPEWIPLGSGIVQTPEFLKIMREAGFSGPISLHFEYKTSSNDALIDDMRNAVTTLRQAMNKAGYA